MGDEDFFLNKSQARNLLKLAKVGNRDVFYDLGCGDGLVVCMAVSLGHAKKAVGVEVDRENFELSTLLAVDRLTKKQLKKVSFWFGHIDNAETIKGELLFDYHNATVAYHSLEEEEDDLKFFQKSFDKRKIRIIRKDLPLIGYAPLAVNRKDPDCWFFMHKFPIKRVRNKNEWAKLVLGNADSDIKNVRTYIRNRLEKRDIGESDIRSSLRDFNRLACDRFSS